jgi:hypothetical protein
MPEINKKERVLLTFQRFIHIVIQNIGCSKRFLWRNKTARKGDTLLHKILEFM